MLLWHAIPEGGRNCSFHTPEIEIYYGNDRTLRIDYGHEAMIKFLLKRGEVDIDTALSTAVQRRNIRTLESVLETGGFNIDAYLQRSIEEGLETAVEFLFKLRKVYLNTTDEVRQAAYLLAVKRGNSAIVKSRFTTKTSSLLKKLYL